MTAVVYTPNKTVAGTLLTFTQQATATVTVGTAFDVSAKFLASIAIRFGRSVATALSNQIALRLEASWKSSGNDAWSVIRAFTTAAMTTAGNATTLNGATTAGNTTAVVSSATGIVAGSWLYFRETGTPANSEWSRVASISGTTVTFEEAQTRNHTNGIAIVTLPEAIVIKDLDVSTYSRIRLVVDTASNVSGQTVDIEALINTLDGTTGT